MAEAIRVSVRALPPQGSPAAQALEFKVVQAIIFVMHVIRFLVVTGILSWTALAHAQTPMAFRVGGPHWCQTCQFIVAEGDIESSTPDAFSRFAARQDLRGREIYLGSDGGNIDAAMTMGGLFRRHGMTTVIGWGQRCLGACLLAFVGGTERILAGYSSPDSLVREHRPGFIAPEERVPAMMGAWRGQATLTNAQRRQVVAHLARLGGASNLIDLLTVGPSAAGPEATMHRFAPELVHAMRLVTAGPQRPTWYLRRVDGVMHAMTTRAEERAPVSASFYRDNTGLVWLRLWPRTQGRADVAAEFSRLRRTLRWIYIQGTAFGGNVYANWPYLHLPHLRFGQIHDEPWVDLWLGENAGQFIGLADRIAITANYSATIGSRDDFRALTFIVGNGHATILEALGPAPVR